MKFLKLAWAILLFLSITFATISADCAITVDDYGYATVGTQIYGAGVSCANVKDAYADIESATHSLTKAASGCTYYFTKYLSPGAYTVKFFAVVDGAYESQSCTVSVPSYPLTLKIHSPESMDAVKQGLSNLYFQASVYSNGLIAQSASLTAEIIGKDISSTVSLGTHSVFAGYLDVSKLDPGVYAIRFTAVDGAKKAIAYVNFEVIESVAQTESSTGNLRLTVLMPEGEKKYPTRNILVRAQIKDKNGLITEKANVKGDLYQYVNNEWKELRVFDIEFSVRYYQENIELHDDGKYKLKISASYIGDSAAEDVIFYVGETNVTQEVAPIYNIYLVVSSPTAQNYALNQEVPLHAIFKDSNGLYLTGNVKVTLFDPDNKKITTKEMSLMKNIYAASHSFAEEGVYTAFFEGGYKGYQANKTAFIYVATDPEAADQLSVKIITPQPDVYPDDAKLIARAKIKYKGEPVKNATVVAVVNELEYQMKYDQYGEYYVKLPMLSEDSYGLTIIAKSGDLVGEEKSDFAISKHRLDLELVYPEEDAKVFIKRDEPVTMSFNVYDEVQDIAHGAEVVVTFTDPEGQQTQSQIYQTETGEYTGAVYFDQDGAYTYTATAILAGSVPDSLDSNFSLDIEDVYVFGVEFETLLNIILIIAIVILAAGLLRRAL